MHAACHSVFIQFADHLETQQRVWQNGANLKGLVDELFLKEDYLGVFRKLHEYASDMSSKLDFIKVWHRICDLACDGVKVRIMAFADENAAGVVASKFRGNLGEIMAEKLFKEFGNVWNLNRDTYEPVDPEHEMFVDARARHVEDGLPVGIQIKNYRNYQNKASAVGQEVFVKSMAMTTYWLQEETLVKPEDLQRYLGRPRQIIFSFTPVSYDIVEASFAKSVLFIGPDRIKKLDLGKMPFVFKNIADEIAAVPSVGEL